MSNTADELEPMLARAAAETVVLAADLINAFRLSEHGDHGDVCPVCVAYDNCITVLREGAKEMS